MDRNEFTQSLKKVDELIDAGLNKDKIYNLIKLMPKTEIHIHAEAVVTFETIFFLNRKYNTSSEIKTVDELKNIYEIHNLSKMIDFFLFFQACFRKEEDLKLLVRDLYAYIKRNNIYYIELFFSPSGFLKNGLVFEKMFQILEKSFDDIYQKDGRTIKLIIDVSRTFGVPNAEANLEYTLNYIKKYKKTTRIIGIGLGGSEKNGPAIDYMHIFKKAKENKLKTVAHAEKKWDRIHMERN